MTAKPLLKIERLTVEVEGKRLLDGIDLVIRPGEIHVIFGPNGSGKSSLINTIMGIPPYRVIGGDIQFNGTSILSLPIDERARLGIGLAFQQSPTVADVSFAALSQAMGIDKEEAQKEAHTLGLLDHLARGLNAGFSGGERKRGELLQLLWQQPQLIMLDEPESGVDVESIQLLTATIARVFQKDLPIRERTVGGIIITHTGSILEELHATHGYVLVNGRLMCSGSPLEIFDQVKAHGFAACLQEARTEKRAYDFVRQ
jgi:Fe-S cluster assembly ATP-binding protein